MHINKTLTINNRPLIRKYDIKTFILKHFKTIHRVWTCIKKGFNWRLGVLCDIGPLKTIPRSTIFPHPYGISIKGNAVIGENVMIRQNTTIGIRRNGIPEGETIIGDNVDIGASVIILGEVNIGAGATIGAGAIVLKDVPAGETVVGLWK